MRVALYEALQFAVKRGAAHAEQLGGLQAVALGLPQRGEEAFALAGLGGEDGGRRGKAGADFGRQVGGLDLRALAVNRGEIDTGAQFADIARGRSPISSRKIVPPSAASK